MRKPRLTVGLFVDHAKAVRIPLLIIAAAIVLTFWVDQIWELFLLLTTDPDWLRQVATVTMTGILGFAVWHTGRTVYRFDIPTIPTLSDPRAEGLREWLPRVLGTSVPLLMAIGSWTALHDPSLRASNDLVSMGMPTCFLAEALVLFVFFIVRRRVFQSVSSLAKTPAGDRRVNSWSQLPRSVRTIYALIFAANALALLVAAQLPGLLSRMGALDVVLTCASFLTVSGTYLTIQAARWQFPLLTALLILAVVLQAVGWNDNHRVRLYGTMHSTTRPKLESVELGAPLRSSFASYAKAWQAGRAASERVYIVSAEGGGIRAAAWTALVLAELEVRSKGEFSRHMLFGSGVSGGSLGLAWFAAIVKGEREGLFKPEDLEPIVRHVSEADYLGPTIETMLLTDFLQRFWPYPTFIDRGERLESGWERSWSDACRALSHDGDATSARDLICSLFGQPWKNLWNGAVQVPLLFLNSTEVQSGRRFIQQPFNSVREDGQDIDVINAATLSTKLLPASAPLSAVVHNSARFTYLSPAGTLLDLSNVNKPQNRQLVDGGYFENSGMTSLAEFAVVLGQAYGAACLGSYGLGNDTCPIRVIHISNDPLVESMRSDDKCPEAGESGTRSRYGEIRAPVMALVNTRDGRAAVARAAVRTLLAQGRAPKSATDTLTDSLLFHFRLCKGVHHLPLGWALSAQAFGELQRQLRGIPKSDPGGFNLRQLETITYELTRVSAP
jgi:hypothetical protein